VKSTVDLNGVVYRGVNFDTTENSRLYQEVVNIAYGSINKIIAGQLYLECLGFEKVGYSS